MAMHDLHDHISKKAYHIWEQEGRPAGRECDHWLRAEREFLRIFGSGSLIANGDKPQASHANGTSIETLIAADDLMRIKGVGKTIAGKLNAIGVNTLAQVAGWTAEDISDINEKLALRGRIQRGNWVAQAKALVDGH